LSRPQKSSSLWPREHGAYAQIVFPLITALALGALGLASALLLVAITAIFLAHEPVLVLTGGRGGRAKRDWGAEARRRLAILLAIGLAAGIGGLWLASPDARFSALIPLALGALLAPLTITRQEKTMLGELLVAVALPATMIPVAVAGGVEFRAALSAAAVWAIVFTLGTITVRGIIARAKKSSDPGWVPVLAPALSTSAIAVGVFLAVTGKLPALVAVAALPTAFVALVFGILGVHPRNLRRMGWTLVASNLAVLAALAIGLR
jgi:hypothetical protein